MQQNDIDKHLNEIAVLVSKEQGLQFADQQEAQKHLNETTGKLRQMLQQSSAMFVEGLKHLADRNEAPVSGIARQILSNLRSPDKLTKILETHVVKDPQSLELFSEAVNSFYGCGDFHIEECVIAVLLTLFPLEPQPFACYGTLIWRRNGIDEAVNYYKNIVDLFENPILDYFGADCYYKAGLKNEARVLIDRAATNAEKEPELYSEIMQFIRIMIKEF